MKKEFRLQKNWEFEEIINSKQQIINKYLVVYYVKSKEFKIGITIPKKFCNAVQRNYQKRQLKSIIHSLKVYDFNFKFVFIIRKDFLNLDYETKHKITLKVFEKLKHGK